MELQKYNLNLHLCTIHTFSTPCIFTLTSLAPQIAIHNGVKEFLKLHLNFVTFTTMEINVRRLNVNFTFKVYYNQNCLAVRSGKKSPNQETGLGNRGCLKVLNDIKFVLNEHESLIIQDQFGIIQSIQSFPIFQTSFLVGTFFAASYSKLFFEFENCRKPEQLPHFFFTLYVN